MVAVGVGRVGVVAVEQAVVIVAAIVAAPIDAGVAPVEVPVIAGHR